MPILSARFTLPVQASCLLELPDDAIVETRMRFGDFDGLVRLLASDSDKSKLKGDQNWTTAVCAVEVTLSRVDPEDVPQIVEHSDGTRDLTAQGEFLFSRLEDYKVAAREIANRTLRFFRYTLMTPAVREIPSWDQDLATPTWFDHTGKDIGKSRVLMAQPIPGLRGELGVERFTLDRLPELTKFLQESTEPSLDLALLSDAQTAWFENSLRRTVLELAICTELLVKRRFFSAASPAGAAFDYLEDKSKVSVRVLDLLDAIAIEAFARSYRNEHPEHYKRIDFMFRCRNKIAHRAELSYRDDSGQSHQPKKEDVAEWWTSVTHLRTWLGSL